MWDWDTLKEKIVKNGVRNSLTTACMPTASTGIILGNTETFQIQTSNIYKRQTLSGEFLLVNRYLVKQLSKNTISSKTVSFRGFGFSLASINTIFSFVLFGIFLKLFKKYESNK